MTGMTTSELAAALLQIRHESAEVPAGYASASQLAEALGVAKHHANHLLRRSIQAGAWEFKGRFRVPNVTGAAQSVPFYGPVEPDA